MKAGSLYDIGTDDNVWRAGGTTTPVQVGTSATAIGASSDVSVTVVSSAGTLWRKPTDDAAANWGPVPGTAVQVAAPNRTTLVTVSATGTISRQ